MPTVAGPLEESFGLVFGTRSSAFQDQHREIVAGRRIPAVAGLSEEHLRALGVLPLPAALDGRVRQNITAARVLQPASSFVHGPRTPDVPSHPAPLLELYGKLVAGDTPTAAAVLLMGTSFDRRFCTAVGIVDPGLPASKAVAELACSSESHQCLGLGSGRAPSCLERLAQPLARAGVTVHATAPKVFQRSAIVASNASSLRVSPGKVEASMPMIHRTAATPQLDRASVVFVAIDPSSQSRTEAIASPHVPELAGSRKQPSVLALWQLPGEPFLVEDREHITRPTTRLLAPPLQDRDDLGTP